MKVQFNYLICNIYISYLNTHFIFLLILLNLLALLLESAPAIEAEYRQLFHWFDLFSVAVFSAEYLLRLYLAPEDPDFDVIQGLAGLLRSAWCVCCHLPVMQRRD